MFANLYVLFCFHSTLDPIYALATPFRVTELKSASKKILMQPPSYDRTVIESRWRNRNRMRTNRRMPLVSNDPGSRATGSDNSCSENGVTAPKKSRLNDSASESLSERVVPAECHTDNPSDGSKSRDSKLTESICMDSNSIQSSNITGSNSDAFESTITGGNSDAFESTNVSTSQPQCNDSITQVIAANARQAVDAGLKVEDCWWNKVDSRTWLQGVQSYLLLHSATGVETCRMPVAVLSPNAAPYTVIANPASCRQATTSVIMQSPVAHASSLQTNHRIPRPVFAPIMGYRVATNGVLSAVPMFCFPVVNCSVRAPTSVASVVGCQESYLGGQRSSLAAVDLVSFMHNYCLPPSGIPQSSVNPAIVQTGHDVARQNVGQSSSEGAGGSSLTNGVTTACEEQSVPSVLEQSENSHSGSWPIPPESSNSVMVGNLSRSSVCLTPRSLSSVGSVECFSADASEVTLGSSVVVVDSEESGKGVDDKTSSLFSEVADLTVPGWFGKGLSIRRSKRRMSRQS